MPNSEATGRIKVLKTPDGEAPVEIRRAWEGLILPCFPHIGIPTGELSEVLSGNSIENERRGVIVPQGEAISVLMQFDREAAGWWMAHGCGKDDTYFFFFEDEIGIMSGVSEVPMRVLDDMETGRHWKEVFRHPVH